LNAAQYITGDGIQTINKVASNETAVHPLSRRKQKQKQFRSFNPSTNEIICLNESNNIRVMILSEKAVKGFETALTAAFLFTVQIAVNGDSALLTKDLLQFFKINRMKQFNINVDNSRDILIDARDRQVVTAAEFAAQLFESFVVQLLDLMD
jgi:hypothetical protein